MILSVWRLLRNLNRYQYVTIIVSILVQGTYSTAIALWGPDSLISRASLLLLQFPALLVIVTPLMALAARRDRSKAAQFVAHEVEVLSGEIRPLIEQHGDSIGQHGDSIKDLRRQIDDQDGVFRSAFEGLGVVLPGKVISLRARPMTMGAMTSSSATVTVIGGSKRGRLLRLFRRFGSWIKETVWGKPDHH